MVAPSLSRLTPGLLFSKIQYIDCLQVKAYNRLIALIPPITYTKRAIPTHIVINSACDYIESLQRTPSATIYAKEQRVLNSQELGITSAITVEELNECHCSECDSKLKVNCLKTFPTLKCPCDQCEPASKIKCINK